MPSDESSDAVWKLRDVIHGAARLCNARSDVRNAALAAIHNIELVEWVQHYNSLPLSVLGVVVLKAAAIQQRMPDAIDDVMRTYCMKHDLSMSTANEAVAHVERLLGDNASSGIFRDGIF